MFSDVDSGSAPSSAVELKIDRRLPAPRQLYEQLRRAIVCLEYQPGKSLSENEIAQISALSRTPIREALRQLREEGLIDVYPNLGSFVSKIDAKLVGEAIRLRRIVEPDVAAQAAASGQRDEIARKLGAIVASQGVALAEGRLDDLYELDESFHKLLFDMLELPFLWSMIRVARGHMDRLHYLSINALGPAPAALEHHRAIVAAIAKADVEQARECMASHLDMNESYLDDLAKRHSEYFL